MFQYQGENTRRSHRTAQDLQNRKKAAGITSLRFILQPILENAINHGLAGSLSKQEKIMIRSYLEEEKLILTIEDNGNGMTKEQIRQIMQEKTEKQKHFNGIGIPNVMERIRLFFGEEYGLRYESEVGEFTRVIFTLPVIREEDQV